MSGIFEGFNPIYKIKFIQNHGWEISEKDAEYFEEHVGKLSFRSLVFLDFEKNYTALTARKIKQNIPELYGYSDWRFLNMEEDYETIKSLLDFNFLSLPDLKIWMEELHHAEYWSNDYAKNKPMWYAYYFDTREKKRRWDRIGNYSKFKIMFVRSTTAMLKT